MAGQHAWAPSADPAVPADPTEAGIPEPQDETDGQLAVLRGVARAVAALGAKTGKWI